MINKYEALKSKEEHTMEELEKARREVTRAKAQLADSERKVGWVFRVVKTDWERSQLKRQLNAMERSLDELIEAVNQNEDAGVKISTTDRTKLKRVKHSMKSFGEVLRFSKSRASAAVATEATKPLTQEEKADGAVRRM